MDLIKFLLENWKVQFKSILKENQKLLLSFLDGTASMVTTEHITKIPSLTSDHEEADSKMFVFVYYMVHNLSVQRLVISSPDTDVAVLCCFHYYNLFQSCAEFFFKTGVKDRRRFIPIHTICDKFGATICNMLPIFHCITGCDSTSSFAGVGKKTALEVLVEQKEESLALSEFGKTPNLDETSNEVTDAIKFVSWLYQPKSVPNSDINELRYRLFCQKKLNGEKLPPAFDSLILHLKRANYQCFIWKNATKSMHRLPSPIGNGWAEDEEHNLIQNMMENPPAPKAIVELTVCRCQKGCLSKACSCRKYNLLCRDACLCSDFGCENTDSDTEYSYDSDED